MGPAGRALRRAGGIAVAAGLIARHATAGEVPRTAAERLADLPTRGLPLAHEVSIRWNAHLVPFIEAQNELDLATALGVVHAHLRAGQIEVLRRVSAGRVAEMAGPLAIDIDRAIRSLGIADTVPRLIAAMPAATRAWAEAFLAGLNAALTAGPPPPEFAILGIEPTPWTLVDFFTLARLFSADLAWPVQRRLLALRDATAPAEWTGLWRELIAAAVPDPRPNDALGQAIAAATRAGSNAAAIAGARTRSGRPIVAGDPHLGLTLPNPWLIGCLSGGGIEALGLMLPGMPFLALGRNRDVAWGGTSLHASSSDLVDVSGLAEAAFESRQETILVRGGRPVRAVRRISPHGPVVSDEALFRSRRTRLALRWAGQDASDELTAMLGVMRARDGAAFRASLRSFGIPGQTMVYAGPDGIGREVAVHLPRRPPGPPADLVVPPDTAGRDWAELVTGGDLLSERDPPDGVIASANEALVGAPPDRIPIGQFFAPASRVRRIRALLAPGRTISAADMSALLQDTAEPGALALRDRLLGPAREAVRGRGARLERALVSSLADWDGDYSRASAGALAHELLVASVAEALIGRQALARLQTVWINRWLIAARIDAASPEALGRAVARALPPAARRFRRVGTWGRAHTHRVRHVLGAVPGLGRRFASVRFEGEGGNETLNKTGHGLVRGRHRIGFGATARYVFDLADADANEIVLFGGQDGWPGSAASLDQLALWRQGRAMALPLRPETAAARFAHATRLQPAGTRP